MNEIITQYSTKTAQSLIENNLDAILATLSDGIDRQITEDEAILLTNAIKISLTLGVSQIISTLCSAGVLDYSEDALRRLLLNLQ